MRNFSDDRLMCLGMTRGRFSGFSIDLRRRPYNILTIPCESVIDSRNSRPNSKEIKTLARIQTNKILLTMSFKGSICCNSALLA